jgi:hypothetical protein
MKNGSTVLDCCTWSYWSWCFLLQLQSWAEVSVRGMIPSGLHSYGVWNWRSHGFGALAAAFGATFLQLQKATLGTGSRPWNDPVRPSLSFGLELAGARFWRPGCCMWSYSYNYNYYFLTTSESNFRHTQPSLEIPRPAFTHLRFGTDGRTVLETRLLHLELLSYSFRKQR